MILVDGFPKGEQYLLLVEGCKGSEVPLLASRGNTLVWVVRGTKALDWMGSGRDKSP